MRLLSHDIQPPATDPERWELLVADCTCRAGKVRKALHAEKEADCDGHNAIANLFAAALLTQLWRDVRVDVMEHGQLFIPIDVAAEHGLDLALMRKALSLDTDRGCEGDARDSSCHCANMPNTAMRIVLPAYRAAMRDLVQRTETLWDDGPHGLAELPHDERRALRGVELECRATLRMIARRGYDTLTRRPSLGAVSRAWLRLHQLMRV